MNEFGVTKKGTSKANFTYRVGNCFERQKRQKLDGAFTMHFSKSTFYSHIATYGLSIVRKKRTNISINKKTIL